MIAWKRATLLGLASWLTPFVISFLVFPLKRSNAPLFETLMTLIVLVTAGALFQLYFRGRTVSVNEALLVGLLWLAMYRPPDYGEPVPVEVQELPSMKILFLRHVGPYSQVGGTWGRLMSWAGMRGLLGPQMGTIGVVYDDPDITPADKVRYDAAVMVNRRVQPEGEFGVRELPGGKYAVFTHHGPYDTLGINYQRFFGGWLPKSGRELRDAEAFEEYLNSPMNTRPEDLLTRLHVPLRD
jgi:DNA gyrase inhibitor GyrI